MAFVVGITGASGAIYGLRLLQCLQQANVETVAIVTETGAQTLAHECGVTPDQLQAYATVYQNNDLAAPPASGSWNGQGMVIAPCSMNSLSMIACGVCPNLLTRAAAVALKEQQPLILVPRETPLSAVHLGNMHTLALAGALILPACPSFYTHPTSIQDLVDGVTARILDRLGVAHALGGRWQGGTTA